MVSNTSITLTAYLVIKAYTATAQTFTVNTYGQLGDHTKKIVLSSFGSIWLTSSTAPATYATYKQFYIPYYASTTVKKNYYEIEATVTLRSNSLSNPNLFEVEEPWLKDPLGTQRLVYRSNSTVTSVDWMEPIQAINTTTLATYTLPVNHLANYDMATTTEYTLHAASHFSNITNDFSTDLAGTASKFWFKSIKAGAYT